MTLLNSENLKVVDPVQLYISIAGEGYFYLSNRYTLSRIFGHDSQRIEEVT
jgi:hypothetical protein